MSGVRLIDCRLRLELCNIVESVLSYSIRRMKTAYFSALWRAMLVQNTTLTIGDMANISVPHLTYPFDDPSNNFCLKFIAYIVIGALMICANTPILVTLLRHSVLRAKKEYLLLAGSVLSLSHFSIQSYSKVRLIQRELQVKISWKS